MEVAGGIPFEAIRPVAGGWPPCLRIIAATALLVRDADKLTCGQQLSVFTPYAIEGVLKQPPGKWISSARLTHYQALLLDAPWVHFSDLLLPESSHAPT